MKYNNNSVFSFVSLLGHFWCRSRRFDCILLVFIKRWGRLVTRRLLATTGSQFFSLRVTETGVWQAECLVSLVSSQSPFRLKRLASTYWNLGYASPFKQDALLWLVGFQQLCLAHFYPRCFGLFPRRIRCRTVPILIVGILACNAGVFWRGRERVHLIKRAPSWIQTRKRLGERRKCVLGSRS